MNVTKEEYLAALAIVEKYHSQSDERKRLHKESFNGLKKGDVNPINIGCGSSWIMALGESVTNHASKWYD